MTAEVNNVLKQLAVIQLEILNPLNNLPIVAYDTVPYVINAADMPLFVNFPGPLVRNDVISSDDRGRDFNEVRTYTMNLYYAPYASGVEGEKTALMVPFFSLVYNKFGQYPHLKQLGGVLDAKLVGDSGTTTLTFIGQQDFAIKFSLQVVSKVRRLLDSRE